jgi:hypothetical protein
LCGCALALTHRLRARAREAVQQHAALACGGTPCQAAAQQRQHHVVWKQRTARRHLRHLPPSSA